MSCQHRGIGRPRHPGVDLAEANFQAAVVKLEERLEGREWLVGGELSAADITCAAVLYRIRSSGVLPWPEGFPRSEELSVRLMKLLD